MLLFKKTDPDHFKEAVSNFPSKITVIKLSRLFGYTVCPSECVFSRFSLFALAFSRPDRNSTRVTNGKGSNLSQARKGTGGKHTVCPGSSDPPDKNF